jgi:hypothetical protein
MALRKKIMDQVCLFQAKTTKVLSVKQINLAMPPFGMLLLL